MNIRQVEQTDQQLFALLLETIDAESEFMLFEKNERKVSQEQAEKMISTFQNSINSTLLIAEIAQKLVGYIMASGGKVTKNKHTAYLVLGVLQDYSGKGIGTKLMKATEEWAKQVGVTRLELTTMVHNEAALALYKKMGFEVEGLKRRSFVIDDKSVDEYYLAKLLNEEWRISSDDKSTFI